MTKKVHQIKQNGTLRLTEIDVLRGVAIVLMVVYHCIFLLRFMGVAPIDFLTFGWLVVARTASTVFLLLVGVSLVVSYQKAHQKVLAGVGTLATWRVHTLKRGVVIFSLGIVITLVTAVLVPLYTVYFGVLHLIGVGVGVGSLVVSSWKRTALVMLLVAVARVFVPTRSAESLAWVWLGHVPPSFQTLDYWPVSPWLSLILGGVLLGQALFSQGERKYPTWHVAPVWQPSIRVLSFLGRHSLALYIVHIPVLVGLVWILKVL